MAKESVVARESSVNPINAIGSSVRTKSDGLPEGAHFHKMRVDGIPQGMIEMAGRKIVLVNVNGVDMPFYLSTGSAKKQNVESGKWYPFFGLDPDGWFNKTNEADISNYYGSTKLRDIAHSLDKKWGDIREQDKGKKVASSYRDNPTQFESIRSQINRDMDKSTTASYKGQKMDYAEFRSGGKMDEYYKRIRNIIRRIEK